MRVRCEHDCRASVINVQAFRCCTCVLSLRVPLCACKVWRAIPHVQIRPTNKRAEEEPATSGQGAYGYGFYMPLIYAPCPWDVIIITAVEVWTVVAKVYPLPALVIECRLPGSYTRYRTSILNQG